MLFWCTIAYVKYITISNDKRRKHFYNTNNFFFRASQRKLNIFVIVSFCGCNNIKKLPYGLYSAPFYQLYVISVAWGYMNRSKINFFPKWGGGLVYFSTKLRFFTSFISFRNLKNSASPNCATKTASVLGQDITPPLHSCYKSQSSDIVAVVTTFNVFRKL